MIIEQNTTALDVAFNLSGSLTGFPVVLDQLPSGTRIGFDNMPKMWEDVADIGQTWTPNIQGRDLTLDVPVYNTVAMAKQPYSTGLFQLASVIEYGNQMLKELVEEGVIV